MLIGTKLEESHAVIGSELCTDVTSNLTHLTCTVPAGTGDNIPIKVVKNDGSGELVYEDGWGYYSPTIASISGCEGLAEVEGDGTTTSKLTVNCPTTGKGLVGNDKVRTGEE